MITEEKKVYKFRVVINALGTAVCVAATAYNAVNAQWLLFAITGVLGIMNAVRLGSNWAKFRG